MSAQTAFGTSASYRKRYACRAFPPDGLIVVQSLEMGLAKRNGAMLGGVSRHAKCLRGFAASLAILPMKV